MKKSIKTLVFTTILAASANGVVMANTENSNEPQDIEILNAFPIISADITMSQIFDSPDQFFDFQFGQEILQIASSLDQFSDFEFTQSEQNQLLESQLAQQQQITTPAEIAIQQPLNNSGDGGQSIILDGVPFRPTAPFEIVNDRLLVPFREIGEAMGATVHWQGDFQRITIFRGDRYSIMHIGSPSVQYGEFTIDQNGHVIFQTQNLSQMDAPPTIINDLTYIPLRAISETLGASISWNEFTSTATIVSPPITPPEPPTPPAPPEPEVVEEDDDDEDEEEEDEDDLPLNFGDFSNTSHFRIISSRQAQSRFQDSATDSFVLVVYDSTSEDSKRIVPDIQDIAQSINFRVYAVDKAASNNNSSENAWMWNFIRQSNFTDPSIFYIQSPTNVRVDSNPNLNNLAEDFRHFQILVETGIEIGDFRNTNTFRNVTSREIEDMYRNNEEFIFVLYDSSDNDSRFYIPIIKAAAREADQRVYAVDIDRNASYHNHLRFLPAMGSNLHRRIPMLYLVYSDNNRNRTEVYDRPRNVDTAISLLEEFQNNTLNTNNNNNSGNNNNNNNHLHVFHNQFRSVDAHRASEMFQANRNNYIIVLFDSSITDHVQRIEGISDAARALNMGTIWSLDLNTLNNNSPTEWFNRINTVSRPVMLHVIDRDIEDFTTFTAANNIFNNAFNTAFDFINDAFSLN